jgi:hypothetical protein
MVASHHRGLGGIGVGPTGSDPLPRHGVLWYLLESFRVFVMKWSHDLFWYLGPLWWFFCINPAKNIDSPKLVETISNNLLLYSIYPFWSFMEERLTVHGILYLPSTPYKYTFALRIPFHLLWCWCNTCTNHITNDMIHFISSRDLVGSSILTSLALHCCVSPSAPSHHSTCPSHLQPVHQAKLFLIFSTLVT